MVTRALALTAVLAAVPDGLRAQRVVVTVRDSALRTGVAAALVTAVDQQASTRVYGVTDDAGRVALKLPAAGMWVVSVRRIGIVPATAAAVRVDSAQTVAVSIGIRNVRFTLPAVRVTARAGVCGRAVGSDDRTAALWEQVTLALRTSTLQRADSGRNDGLRVQLFERALNRSRKVLRQTPLRSGTGRGRPFFAADPDSLAQYGYVRRDRGGIMQYFAPDEVVLLSDAFVRTHCFEVPPTDRDARLAELQFRPTPDHALPDVAGTAFVDAGTGELRRIEFRFVNTDNLFLGLRPDTGGDVSMRRLPDGRWIVSDWTIRMPTFLRTAWRGADALTGYREVGGTIDAADVDVVTEQSSVAQADSAAVTSPEATALDSSTPSRSGDTARSDSIRIQSKVYQFGQMPGTTGWSGRRIEVTPSRASRADSARALRAQTRAPGNGITARMVEVRSGFELRRRFGVGEFLDSTALAQSAARTAVELLPLLPDVRLFSVPAEVPAPPADDDLDLAREWRAGATLPMVPMPGADSAMVSLCLVKLFLDDKRASVAELLSLASTDVAAMEFYRDPRDVPDPFRRSGNRCGTVVLWSYSDLRSVR
jgi:hypothetical protein